jgi:ESCRT-I complex subunit VPS28
LHEVTDLESFMKKYSFSCPAAYNRLKIGVPATIEHGGLTEVEGKKVSQYVAEVVQVNLPVVLLDYYYFTI